MKVKFQADNDFDGRIIRALLRLNPAIDFQTAPAVGFHLGTPDDQVIVSQELPIREAAYLLLLIWEASEAEEYVNSISRLPWPTT